MDYITTYSGEDFSPLDPDISQIKINDIAHAVSLICRANGHFKRFFSVAQHSINCAIEAKARNCSKKVQLACLLHDASEAYISDITRPIKKHLARYIEIENHLQELIYDKFIDDLLTDDEKKQIEQIDDDMLVCEFKILMKKPVFDREPQIKGDLHFNTVDCQEVENQYLRMFNSLNDSEIKFLFSKREFLSVGIDGCKGKWLVVALSEKGHSVRIFEKIDDVCECYKNADSMLLDMPIGLSESKTEIRPDADLRKNLKGKASSVFNTPCRQAVYEADYNKASDINNQIIGCKLSRQSFAITSKIKEVDCFLQTHPAWKNRLAESHPEYSFAILNNGAPILENKQTPEGTKKRLEILGRYYPNSYEVVDLFKSTYPALSSKRDDLLDALSLALIGAIGLETGFTTMPESPMSDSQGIKMQIVGAKIPSISEV